MKAFLFLLFCGLCSQSISAQPKLSCDRFIEILSQDSAISNHLGLANYTYQSIDSIIIVDLGENISRDCSNHTINGLKILYYWNKLPFHTQPFNTRNYKRVNGKGVLVLDVRIGTNHDGTKRLYHVWQMNHNHSVHFELFEDLSYQLESLGVY